MGDSVAEQKKAADAKAKKGEWLDGDGKRPLDPSLDRALRVLGEILKRGRAKEFSDEGLAVLLKLQLEYIEELGSEAIRRANRNRCDVVSANDLEGADQSIRNSTYGRAWFEAIGGIFAGAGIGTFLQLAVGDNPPTVGLAISGAVALVGFTTVAAALARQRALG
jgi:hypothetical protein